MVELTRFLRRGFVGFTCIGLFWMFPAAALADELYAIRNATPDSIGTDLISIDPDTGQGTSIGIVRVLAFPYGLSDKGSELFAYYPDDPNSVDNLVQIDPTDGSILAGYDPSIANTLGDSFVASREGALAFRSDGVGFLANNGDPDSDLWSFNVGAPIANLVSSVFRPLMDGMDFDGAGELYGINQPSLGETYGVYWVDQATGVTVQVGDTGVANGSEHSSAGLTFTSDGTMYAVLNDRLYTLNPGAGYAGELVGEIGFTRISGLTALIPEPATVLLAGLGCVVLFRVRRSP